MKVHRRKRRSTASQFLYERILLSVYGLADAEGLYCNRSNGEIGRDVGKSPETVRSYLADLASDGHIRIFHMQGCTRTGSGRFREIVIMDHPQAASACRWLARMGALTPRGYLREMATRRAAS